MALTRALVDRARAVYTVEDTSQEWVEGEPWGEQQIGPWFPCRLTVEQPTEGVGVPGLRGLAGRGYHRMEASAHLIIGLVYSDGSSLTDDLAGTGNFIAFDDGMLLQIESQASADAVWHVDTGIQPIRKLRRVIGWQVGLHRSREPRVTEGPLSPEGTPQPPPLVGSVRDRAVEIVGGEPGL